MAKRKSIVHVSAKIPLIHIIRQPQSKMTDRKPLHIHEVNQKNTICKESKFCGEYL